MPLDDNNKIFKVLASIRAKALILKIKNLTIFA